ncbi:MAG: hypothetical protein ABJJ53_00930 [Sulfitobacter sp.]
MVRTVRIEISDAWMSREIQVYQGEGVQIDVIGGLANTQYVFAIQSTTESMPVIQASGETQITFPSEVLAAVPKTGQIEYSLWQRGEDADVLKRRGRFTVSSTVVTQGLPELLEMPAISGVFEVGQTLTVSAGVWPDTPSLSFSWMRGGKTIPDAAGTSYVVAESDLGYVIGARVTALSAQRNMILVEAVGNDLITDGTGDPVPPTDPVDPDPVVLGPLAATEGVAVSRDVAAEFPTGATGFVVETGTLPAGLVLSAAGVISGAPSEVGQSSCEVAADVSGVTYTGTLAVTVAAAAVVTQGVAFLEAEGQSNIVGFNSVDDLAPEQHKTYPSIKAFGIDSGLGTTSTQVVQQDYVLVPLGQTIEGIEGRQGELNVGASSGEVCPTYGILKAVDDATLWGAAEETWLFKASTSGQHIDEFQPVNAASVWKNKIYGRRQLRADVAASADPVFYQAKVWWQGEANTNTPRDLADLTHDDITGYAAKFEAVYAFDEAQMGAQPPWFLIQLSRNGGSDNDPYTAALNAELAGLCRWHVDITGTITDTGVGHDNRYFVGHDLTNGSNVHLTASQMAQIGAAISTALQTLEGADGFSSARLVAPVPVITSMIAGAVTDGSVTLDLTTTDVGTVSMVAVTSGSPAPSASEIVAGSGGGIIAAQSETFTGLHAPGAALTVTFSGIPAGSDFDVYAILEDSAAVGVIGLSAPVVSSGWDETNSPNILTYSNNGTQVMNTAGANRYAYGSTVMTDGKRYFEIERIGTVSFAGIANPAVPIGGGANGTDKVGWLFSNIQYTGGSVSLGAQPSSADVYQIAVDVDAGLFWVRGDGTGDWNNNASADPATGSGGLDCTGLAGQILPAVGLSPTDANGAILRSTPSEWEFAAPTGFVNIG